MARTRKKQVHPLGPPPIDNPRPRAWGQLPPDTEYQCEPWESAFLGRSMPAHGRDAAGLIVACATPTKARPKEGRLVVETPKGQRYHVSRNVAKLRRRDKETRTYADRADVAAAVDRARKRKAPQLPGPTGLEYPHRRGSSKCDPEHPLWERLDDVWAEELIGLAIEQPGLKGAKEKRAIYKRVKETPTFREAEDAERKCADDFERREDLRHASRGSGRDRDLRQWRREYLAAGGDPGAPEYLDRLAPSTRAAQLRKQGRIEEARQIEREARHRKKHGGGKGAFQP